MKFLKKKKKKQNEKETGKLLKKRAHSQIQIMKYKNMILHCPWIMIQDILNGG